MTKFVSTIATPGWEGDADGDPAEALVGDVVADLEAERVAVERQRRVGVVDLDEACGEREIHAPQRYAARVAMRFSDPARSRLGESSLAMQPGTPSSSLWSRAR